MKNFIFFAIALCCAVLTTPSCKKDSSLADYIAEQTTAQDLVAKNDLSEIVDAEVQDLVTNGFTSGSSDDRGGCAVVTWAQPKGVWPNTITIDYGAGCTLPNGVTIKGKIIANQSNKMNVVGATRQVTFENFFVENIQIEGARTTTFEGPDASGRPVWKKTGAETFNFPDGSEATRNLNHVRTGVVSPAIPDSVLFFEIRINDDGVNRKGDPYTVTSTKDLVKKPLCPWIVSGVLEMKVNDKTRSLDFGDGTCERDATLTLADGTVKEVKIRRRWWR